MDALPHRLSVREMAAAGVSLWSLQRALAQASRLTPVAHVQHLCLQAARRDLETGAPGATVFAIARAHRRRFLRPPRTIMSFASNVERRCAACAVISQLFMA